jgi:hypothetical protein
MQSRKHDDLWKCHDVTSHLNDVMPHCDVMHWISFGAKRFDMMMLKIIFLNETTLYIVSHFYLSHLKLSNIRLDTHCNIH